MLHRRLWHGALYRKNGHKRVKSLSLPVTGLQASLPKQGPWKERFGFDLHLHCWLPCAALLCAGFRAVFMNLITVSNLFLGFCRGYRLFGAMQGVAKKQLSIVVIFVGLGS